MLRQALAVVLCASLAASGCASGGGNHPQTSPSFGAGASDRSVLAEYVQKLPVGSKIRVERVKGDTLKGVLMKASDASLVLQRDTRVPESPVEIPLDQITRVSVEGGSSTGKSVGIGVAVGVASFFGIGLILAAIFSDH